MSKNGQWVIRVKLFLAFLTFLLSICISNHLIIKIFWQGRTGLDICSMGAFQAIWRAWMGASPPTFYALAQGFPLSLAQIHILERLISKDKTNVLRIYSRFLFIFWSLNFSWRKFHLLETLICKVKMWSLWGEKHFWSPFWEIMFWPFSFLTWHCKNNTDVASKNPKEIIIELQTKRKVK